MIGRRTLNSLIIVLCGYIVMHCSGWAALLLPEDVCWVLFMLYTVTHCVFHYTPVSRHKSNMIKGRLKSRYYYVNKSRWRPSQIRSKKPSNKLFMRLTALAAKTKLRNKPFRFDSDSFYIAVDNCASTSFTNNKKDYIGVGILIL